MPSSPARVLRARRPICVHSAAAGPAPATAAGQQRPGCWTRKAVAAHSGNPAAPDSPCLPENSAHTLALYLRPTPQWSPQPPPCLLGTGSHCFCSLLTFLPPATISSPFTRAPPSLLTFLAFGLFVPLHSLVPTPTPLPVSSFIVFLPSPPWACRRLRAECC